MAKLCRDHLRTTTLAQLLHPRMPQRACKTILEPELLTGTLGSFACRSLAHCPSKDLGTWERVSSMVDTFRTCNGHLWLLSLGESQLDLPFRGRCCQWSGMACREGHHRWCTISASDTCWRQLATHSPCLRPGPGIERMGRCRLAGNSSAQIPGHTSVAAVHSQSWWRWSCVGRH